MHRRGRVPLLVLEIGPVSSCLALVGHRLVGPDCEDPFEDWGPDPAHPAQGVAEWACPKKRLVAGQAEVGWACLSGRAADWWGPQKRRASRRRASRRRAPRQRVSEPAGVVLGGLRAKEALTMAQLGEAEAADLRWR